MRISFQLVRKHIRGGVRRHQRRGWGTVLRNGGFQISRHRYAPQTGWGKPRVCPYMKQLVSQGHRSLKEPLDSEKLLIHSVFIQQLP